MKKIVLLFILLAACTPTGDLADYACPDCSIILISIDTFRGDHLTCNGYDKYEVDITENICKLASEGILFTNVISQAPSTQAAHASILTSAIPSHHQSFNSRNTSYAKDYLPLPEILRREKYATAGFTGSGQMSAKYGFDRGFDVFAEFKNDTFRQIAEQGLEWLNETHGPVFLFLHTYEIHHPYTPDPALLKEIEKNYTGTLGTNISVELLKKINNKKHNITQEDLQHIIATYDAEILSVDRTMKWFIEQLKEIGRYNRTIIVITSDHGEEFGEHGQVGWHSHTLYNELLHVPLIIAAPGLKPGVSKKLAMSIDIAPTLLNMVRLKKPETFEGKSLAEGQKYAISERDHGKPVPYAIQTTDVKYYWARHYQYLFNLTKDPGEQNNIFREQQNLATALSTIYNDWVNQTTSNGTQVTVPPELREQLEALGYVE
ncbi:MAG: sulfatase [Candidatus Woesearchaeota archaeon]